MCGKNCGCTAGGGIPWRLVLLALAGCLLVGGVAQVLPLLAAVGVCMGAAAVAGTWATVRLVRYGSVRRPRMILQNEKSAIIAAGQPLAIEPPRPAAATVVLGDVLKEVR